MTCSQHRRNSGSYGLFGKLVFGAQKRDAQNFQRATICTSRFQLENLLNISVNIVNCPGDSSCCILLLTTSGRLSESTSGSMRQCPDESDGWWYVVFGPSIHLDTPSKDISTGLVATSTGLSSYET
jgi:hypothetical protein